MSKSKFLKAEKQEDLEFYDEGERIKFAVFYTSRSVAVSLCVINIYQQNRLQDIISHLQSNEKISIENFISNLFDAKESISKVHEYNYDILESLRDTTIDLLLSHEAIGQMDGTITLIKTMEGLFKSFEMRLTMSSSSVRVHKLHLRRAWKEQKRYKEEIRGLRNELYGLKIAMKARVAAKKRRIKQQEDEIIQLQNTCKEEITRLCAKSEAIMKETCTLSQERQEELNEELQFSERTLSDLQQEHRVSEHNLRTEKKNTERILEETICLYDDTMLKLHSEMKGTEEAYLDEFHQLQMLLVKFEEQEILYKVAMADKEREEEEELDRQILLFRRRIAASKIQICWRAYQARKLERSRGKKGKKGRKKQSGNIKEKNK